MIDGGGGHTFFEILEVDLDRGEVETDRGPVGDHPAVQDAADGRELHRQARGEPVRALCGKVWTPGRDPAKYPVCPDCKRIYEGLPPGGDDES